MVGKAWPEEEGLLTGPHLEADTFLPLGSWPRSKTNVCVSTPGTCRPQGKGLRTTASTPALGLAGPELVCGR